MTWQRGSETGILELVNARTISFTRVRTVLGVAALGLLASACGDDDKPLNTFEPAGPQADKIDNLIQPIFWIAAVIGVLVVGGGILLTIKNRVAPGDYDPLDFPEQVHGHQTAELAWTIAPAILLAVISFFTWRTVGDLEQDNDPGELDVLVIGQQWWWEYRYDVDGDGFFEDINEDGVTDELDEEWPLELALDDDDVSVANELVIPAGEQVDLTITSRDVIHSFWIPRLNGKRDAVPGRVHTWSLEADEPGEYTGWCTEFCGVSHARMRMSAVALEPADFDEWIANQIKGAEQPTDPEAIAGQELFAQQCASCHIVWSTDRVDDQGNPVILREADAAYTGAGNEGNSERAGRDFEAALVSKAAPNLTHFATRSHMASGIFSTYVGLDSNDDELNDLGIDMYLDLPEQIDKENLGPGDIRWNRAQLKRWIKDAPSQKDMEPDQERGMTAFPALSDEQLDQIIAYLATLD